MGPLCSPSSSDEVACLHLSKVPERLSFDENKNKNEKDPEIYPYQVRTGD